MGWSVTGPVKHTLSMTKHIIQNEKEDQGFTVIKASYGRSKPTELPISSVNRSRKRRASALNYLRPGIQRPFLHQAFDALLACFEF